MKENDSISRILKEASLKDRLTVLNDMMLSAFLVDLEFMPKSWTKEQHKKYDAKIYKAAKEHTRAQIRTVKEWEKDGRPIKNTI